MDGRCLPAERDTPPRIDSFNTFDSLPASLHSGAKDLLADEILMQRHPRASAARLVRGRSRWMA